MPERDETVETTDDTLRPGVFVRLTAEQDEQVRRLAAEEERPLTTTLRRLVGEALEARERAE